MAPPPTEKASRSQPSRLVFVGVFKLWAKPRLPPDVASEALHVLVVTLGSGCQVIMSNGPSIRGHTADLTGSEVRDGYLRRWLNLSEVRQRSISLPLVRALLVVVDQIPIERALQAATADEPAAVDALALHRPDPALGKGIQVGAARRDGDGLNATSGQRVTPGSAEFGVPVVDQVAGTNLDQPTGVDHRQVTRSLDHELAYRVFGNADDVDAAGLEMDREKHIIAGLAEQAPHVDGEEISGDQLVQVFGDEGFPGRIGAAFRRGLEAMAIQDGSDGARAQGNTEFTQLTVDAVVTPRWILRSQPGDRLLNLDADLRSSRPSSSDAQLLLQQQAVPTSDGARLGDGGEFGQPLPTDVSSCTGELLPPRIGKSQWLTRGHLVAQIRDLSPEVGHLGDEGFVLSGKQGGCDQADQEGARVHRAKETRQTILHRKMWPMLFVHEVDRIDLRAA